MESIFGEGLLSEYQTTMETSDMDAEDVIQTRMLYLLDHPAKIDKYDGEANYFAASLKWYVRKRSIRTYQQQENILSLNDGETGGERLVSIPTDHYLYKYIMTRKNRRGKYLFSRLQMKVIAKRFLSGKTQREIADELGKSQKSIAFACKTIDTKILSMDIQHNKGPWYHGEGNNTPPSRIWDTSMYEQGEADPKAKLYIPKLNRDETPAGKIPSTYTPEPKGWIIVNQRSSAMGYNGHPSIPFDTIIQEAKADSQRKIESLSYHYYQNVDHSGIVNHYRCLYFPSLHV